MCLALDFLSERLSESIPLIYVLHNGVVVIANGISPAICCVRTVESGWSCAGVSSHTFHIDVGLEEKKKGSGLRSNYIVTLYSVLRTDIFISATCYRYPFIGPRAGRSRGDDE